MQLIEKHFPIERLNRVALSEGNSKKPVYQMHKWWARRLGSVFRMITLATFSPFDEPEDVTWRKFTEGADLGGKIVLDPFMGGGTSIAEALRLGCKVIGLDINPVAWFVTKKEIEPVDLDLLDAAFRELEQSVGSRIQHFYQTACPRGHKSAVMYYFWVKVADCVHCGSRVRLFPNYELSRRDHTNICFCPSCLQIVETAAPSSTATCQECGHVFDPRVGVSGRGYFQCTSCGTQQRLLDAVSRRGSALEMELHALEGYCETCGRFFKRVDEHDLDLWREAKATFDEHRSRLLIPHQRIPTEGRSDPRPVNHGYTHFWQLFNERQLLCLSLLLEGILRIQDQNIRELMLLAFSDCLDSNNMFCKYEIEWHKVSVFFGLHAYHPIERPAENNVWGTSLGRGTFVKCFEKVRRGKLYCQKPYERLFDARGRRYSQHTGHERIEGYWVDDFDQLKATERAALLRCQNSEDLSFLPDQSVDAVITDPPYFENVQYSELADFFYVWLRIALKDRYAWFRPELSGHPDEIVKNDKLGKTTEFFNERLYRVFSECHRVLKDDGLLAFTFHHNRVWAWEGIARLLLRAGFYISATPVVRSEGKSGFHSSKGNIRYDCVLTCRKREGLKPLRRYTLPELQDAIMKDAVSWAQRTFESGMPVNEVDVFTIVMGKSVEHYTKVCTDGRPGGRDDERALRRELADLLESMARLVSYVGAEAEVDRSGLSASEVQSARQLALFVMESRAAYQTRTPPRKPMQPE